MTSLIEERRERKAKWRESGHHSPGGQFGAKVAQALSGPTVILNRLEPTPNSPNPPSSEQSRDRGLDSDNRYDENKSGNRNRYTRSFGNHIKHDNAAQSSNNRTPDNPRKGRWKARRRKLSWRVRNNERDCHLRLEPLKQPPEEDETPKPYRKRSRSRSRRRSRSKSRSENEAGYESGPQTPHRPTKSGSTTPDSPRGSSSPATPKPSLELPGFYYDEVKKRYFKIVPGAFQAPGVVTQEVANFHQNRKKERRKSETKTLAKTEENGMQKERRDRALSETLFSVGLEQLTLANKSLKGAPVSMITPLIPKPRPSLRTSKSLLHSLALSRTESGRPGASSSATTRLTVSSMLQNLRPWKRRKIFERPCNTYEHLDGAIFVDKDIYDQSLLCMWNVKDTMCQRIQLLDLNLPDLNEMDDNAVSYTREDIIIPHSSPMLQSLNKVTDLCWAPEQGQPGSDHWIIYTTTSLMCGSVPSFALLRNLDAPDDPDVGANFSLGSAKVTWSCSWSVWNQRFCIGCERGALMIDARSRRSWDVNTGKQDVLCQTFSETDPNMLFSGLRNGAVSVHDIRSTNNYPRYSLARPNRHKADNARTGSNIVTSIKFPKGPKADENYVFTGTNGGEISMWDLRTRKPVVVLRTGSQVNAGLSKNPIYLDDDLDFLYQGCQDNVVRFWSLTPWGSCHPRPFAQLTAPPPPASQPPADSPWAIPDASSDKDSIPRPIFSRKWQSPGQSSIPLVMTLVRDEIVFYRGLH